MPADAARTRARTGRLALAVLSLLVGGLAMAATASPAAALSSFDVTFSTPQPLVAGSTGDVAVHVFNAGPDVADDVTLELTLPAGVTIVGGDTGCISPGACLMGGFGLIGVGGTSSTTITVEVDADYVLDNGAGAAVANADIPFQVDYDSGAQSGTLRVPVGERSDLRVTKYISPPVADAGTTVNYAIDVDNLGPSTARDVVIAETILGSGPGNVTLQGCVFSVSQGGGIIDQFDCNTGPAVTSFLGADGGTFGTDSLQPVGVYPAPNPGDPDVVGGRLRAAFQLTATEAITLEGQARVHSATGDPNLADNLADVSHSFQAVADLSVTAAPDTTTPASGATVTYTVEATNSGPSTAGNVVVEHHVPAGLDVVSATTPGGTCTTGTPGDSEDPIECLLGVMGPLPGAPPTPVVETITIEALVTASAGSELVSETFVSSETPDRDNSDDVVESVLDVGAPELAFNPVEPARLFDTRTGAGGVPVGRVSAGTPLAFTVVGTNDVPPGAEAVALNVTVTGPLAAGWLRVFPCDDPAGSSSNLNFVAGQTVANAVLAPVDGAGQVCFLASEDTHVIADISGWFRAGDGLTTMTPVRALDTRNGTGGVPIGRLTPGALLNFDVTGVNGVPASGVATVILNVTAAQPLSGGHLTVFPCGEPPLASNVNYRPGASTPNLVVAPVGPDGTVCFQSSGSTHVVVDISGWFDAGSDLHPVNPTRLFDTRNGLGGVLALRLLAGAELEVRVTGRAGLPDDGVGAVVLNLTVVGPLAAGHITVYPCGDRPLTSSLNFLAGQTRANAVLVPVSEDGTVCFSSVAPTHLVVDVSGWLASR